MAKKTYDLTNLSELMENGVPVAAEEEKVYKTVGTLNIVVTVSYMLGVKDSVLDTAISAQMLRSMMNGSNP